MCNKPLADLTGGWSELSECPVLTKDALETFGICWSLQLVAIGHGLQ